MPKLYVFESRKELVSALKSECTPCLAKSFFEKRLYSVAMVVTKGVSGNTFRAFRNLPVRPSVTFRSFATDYINDSMSTLRSISNAEEYDTYINDACLALNQHWRNATGSEMGYGRGTKLLNLVIKKLCCFNDLTQDERDALITLMHVPLDSYTIFGLRKAAPELHIPSNSSATTMRFIETPKQYRKFQKVISSIAQEAGVPPIYYDILAWDKAH